MLPQIFDVVSNILNRIIAVYALAGQIVASLISSGWFIVVQDAANLTTDIHSLLEDPTCGQTAQCTKLDTILSDLATLTSDIAALGNPQQTGVAVTLPSSPPPAYVAPTSSSNASAVWAATSADEATQYGTIVAALSAFLRVFGDSMALPGRLGDHAVYNFSAFDLINNSTTSFVQVDTATILPTHTSILDWLNDVYFHQTWVDNGDGMYWSSVSSPSGHALVMVTVTPGEFLWLRQLNAGKLPATNVPPVWPGLANITLGTPISMDPTGDDLVVDCDGVLVSIDAHPSWAGNFDFGGITSWRNAGAIAFKSDQGREEPAQTLNWADGFYMPRTMNHAAGFCYRIAGGWHGVATPFTINQ